MDQDERIERLKREADRASGGIVDSWQSDALSADATEQFWRNVVDCENAPRTTNFQRLIDAGVELPDPDSIADDRLSVKLWEVIDGMATLNVFLWCTNHLNDRELYTVLWRRLLREETQVLQGWSEHFDLVGDGSEENTMLFLKYYADDDERHHWLEDFPDYEMPPHEDPPYDRDDHLPGPGY